jgi:hypothetical protein
VGVVVGAARDELQERRLLGDVGASVAAGRVRELCGRVFARWAGRAAELERARERGDRLAGELSAGKRVRVSPRSIWPVEALIAFMLRVWSPSVAGASDVAERLAGSASRREWLAVVLRLWTLARPIDVARMRWSAITFLDVSGTALVILAGSSWESVLLRCSYVSVTILSGKGERARRLVLPAFTGRLRGVCVVRALADLFAWWGVSPASFRDAADSSDGPYLLFPLQNQARDAAQRVAWPWLAADVVRHALRGLSSDTVSHDTVGLLRRARVAGPLTDSYPNLSYSLRAAVASWLLSDGVPQQRVMDWGGWATVQVMLSHYACERVAVAVPEATLALRIVRDCLAQTNNISWL